MSSERSKLEVLPLAPTWLSKRDLSLFDDSESERDWDFTPVFIPGDLLSPEERDSFLRYLEQASSDSGESWNHRWLFPDDGETLIALKGHWEGGVQACVKPEHLLGILSFKRDCRWSQESPADLAPSHLYLRYEPKLIYVPPSQRGNRVGTSLMHVLGWTFASDLKHFLRDRPVCIEPLYWADYDSIPGERLGKYCISEFEITIDDFRSVWGWLTNIQRLDVDDGF